MCAIPEDVFRRHGQRLTLNVVFLLLLVFHGNAALKKYVAVTELSPRRLFHLLVVPAISSRALKFAPSTKTSFGRQNQRLYQSVRANYNHVYQERKTYLLGDSDRLRSTYLQRCAAHSSVNFIPVFSTERAVSILLQGKQRRTRTT